MGSRVFPEQNMQILVISLLWLISTICSGQKNHGKYPGQLGYCIPDSIFQEACNVCTCDIDGRVAVCELSLSCKCDRKAVSENDYCVPGEMVKDGCHTCYCVDGELALCTRKQCPTKAGLVGHCVPNMWFNKDCNDCLCNAKGTQAKCFHRQQVKNSDW